MEQKTILVHDTYSDTGPTREELVEEVFWLFLKRTLEMTASPSHVVC